MPVVVPPTPSLQFFPQTASPFRVLRTEGEGSMELMLDENISLCTLSSTNTCLGDCQGRPFQRLSHHRLSDRKRLWDSTMLNGDSISTWLSLLQRTDPFGDAPPQLQRVVFKIAMGYRRISKLLLEADIYHGKNHLAGSVIPQSYGFFTGKLHNIEIALLVLEYCDGPSSATWNSEEFK